MTNTTFYSLIIFSGILISLTLCIKKPKEEVSPGDKSFRNYFSNQRSSIKRFTCDASSDTGIPGSKGTKIYLGGYYISVTNYLLNCSSAQNKIRLDLVEIEGSQIENYIKQINS